MANHGEGLKPAKVNDVVQVNQIDNEFVIVWSCAARRADRDKSIIDDDEIGMNDVEVLIGGQGDAEWPKWSAANDTFYVNSVH